LQFLEDTRKEAREVFSEDEVVFFNTGKTLSDKLEYYLEGDGKFKSSAMKSKSMIKVATKHTYTHRMKHILGCIK